MSPQAVLTFLGNHLWQSTGFALGVGALSLILRNDRAAVRHRLWVLASIKFLIPLSLFVAIGTQFDGIWRAPASVKPTLDTFEQWNEPFSPLPVSTPSVPQSKVVAVPASPFSWATWLLSVWFVGTLVVLTMSFRRWLRVEKMIRAATLLSSGFECDTIMRLRNVLGIRRSIPIVSSNLMIEPGLFGIVRPTLFLPAELREKVTSEQFEAILSHEITHARRHDNMWAMLHMLVEAAFWFNPVVWWIGSRLVDEREQACDQEVLANGCDPCVYSQAIVEVCKSYLGTELKCVSGVTGGALQTRIQSIMIHAALPRLCALKKVALVSLAVSVISVPLVLGSMRTPRTAQTLTRPAATPKWEVVSVKPCGPNELVTVGRGGPKISHGRFYAPCEDTAHLIYWAYDFYANGKPATGFVPPLDKRTPIVGAPSWINSEHYTINAKAEGLPIPAVMHGPMLQKILEDYFKLRIRREETEGPVYELTVARGGLKIRPMQAKSCISLAEWMDSRDPAGPREPPPEVTLCGGGGLRAGKDGSRNLDLFTGTMAEYALMFRLTELDLPVVDRTGTSGLFHFHFAYWPEQLQPSAEPLGATIFTAVQEQLGLKLVKGTGPVPRFVIDHIERPAPDGEATASPSIEPPQIASTRPVLPAALTQAPASRFEVASIKPESPNTAADPVGCRGRDGTYHPAGLVRGEPPMGRCLLPGITLRGLINAAYDLVPNSTGLRIKDRIIGGPSWGETDQFHIEGVADNPANVTQAELRDMLQTLLAERFKLRVHRETRDLPGYALEVSDRGAKLVEVGPDANESFSNSPVPFPIAPHVDFAVSAGERIAKGHTASIGAGLVRLLAVTLGAPILDKTGLTGVYDFALRWVPSADETPMGRSVPAASPSGPSLFTALPEQLGLRLVSQKVPIEVLVIESVEHPSTN